MVMGIMVMMRMGNNWISQLSKWKERIIKMLISWKRQVKMNRNNIQRKKLKVYHRIKMKDNRNNLKMEVKQNQTKKR